MSGGSATGLNSHLRMCADRLSRCIFPTIFEPSLSPPMFVHKVINSEGCMCTMERKEDSSTSRTGEPASSVCDKKTDTLTRDERTNVGVILPKGSSSAKKSFFRGKSTKSRCQGIRFRRKRKGNKQRLRGLYARYGVDAVNRRVVSSKHWENIRNVVTTKVSVQ